jgi:undecaprenyl-diphosphatase
MNIIEAIILGIIQGFSEFLPISSTAHLTLAGNVMGLLNDAKPEQWTAFLATTQLGTLFAIIIYFTRDISSISKAFWKENFSKERKPFLKQSNESRLGTFVIVGTIPIVLFGFLLKKLIESNATKDPLVISLSLIVFGLFLFIADRFSKLKKDMNGASMKDILLIGFAQCLALIPGASRSGVTITAGLLLDFNREAAARFSFLLSIPAVFASGMYEFYKSLSYISGNDLLVYIIAIIAAFISGYASIAIFLNFLKKHSLTLFVVYRLILGLIIIVLVLSNLL